MGRVKGSTLLGAVKFLRSRRPEAASILAPRDRRYLDETISRSGWYPLDDFLSLVRAAADLLGRDHAETFQVMGEFAARSHADLYGDLLMGSGSNSRTFALWSTQFDVGSMRRVVEGPGQARVELNDFQSPGAELCLLIRGYITGALALNEVEDVAVAKLSCTAKGDPLCAWRATWKRNSS